MTRFPSTTVDTILSGYSMASERIVNSIPWDNWNFFVRLLFKLSGTTLNSVSKFLRSGSANKQSLITSFSISSSLKEYESIKLSIH